MGWRIQSCSKWAWPKNGSYETQFKMMLASLDPFGLPLVVDVEPGNRADDPLYIPSYQRVKTIIYP